MAPRLSTLCCCLLLGACYPGGEPLEGFGRRNAGGGPQIVWDLDAEPLPEIPFPNDLATRTDLTSPTGRRLNASLEAPTQFERDLRRHMSELDGFGTFAPIWLRFDAPLDLPNVARRQRGDAEFADDAVLLIDVTRGSPTFGEATVLDFGNGNFPVTLEDTNYWENDTRAEASNLLFETYDEDARGDGDGTWDVWEDRNQNGVLDPGEDLDGDGRLDASEDTDGDGVWDRPNLWGTVVGDPQEIPFHPQHPDCPDHPYFNLVSFYEMETDTLTFRPVVPLRERTTYAVVLTNALVGRDGAPVRSPWAYNHHLQQLEAVAPLFEGGPAGSGILAERFGLDLEDIAFAWTFTTQSVTESMVRLREGLHGIGPFSELAAQYPAVVDAVVPMTSRPGNEAYLLRPEGLVEILSFVFNQVPLGGFSPDAIGPLLDTHGSIDYIVAGDYTSPDFLEAGGGTFDIDVGAGTAAHQPASLRFMLAVPKAAFGTAPFPVLLYCHGYTSMKLEALAFSGLFAKFGMATFVIDAYSHGLPLGPQFDALLQVLLGELSAEGLVPFYDAIKKDRARDLNADGVVDSGGDFWTNDTFHTRDIVRQTLVDYLQAVRMFQGFDGSATWPFDLTGDGSGTGIAGDFNNDGVVDAGGPGNVYYAAGTSMGGILSAILGAVEPQVRAAAPLSGGGGLLEVGLRTELGNVQRAVILPILGPMIITDPLEGDPRVMNVRWLVNDVFNKAIHTIGRIGRIVTVGDQRQLVDDLRPGDVFRVDNLSNDKWDEMVVPADRRVRLHLPCDVGDAVSISVWRPDGNGGEMFPGSQVREGATLVKRLDTYEQAIDSFHGRSYPDGSPLVAIQQGLGYRRNTPSLRRLLGISQAILEPADPVNWAPHYSDPLDIRPEGKDRRTKVLYTVTMGDMTVPTSTGVALARAAGIIGYREPDPRWGMSENQVLIDNHVVEAVEKLHYFTNDCCRAHCGEVNFDVDDLSDGHHPAALPRLAEVVEPLSCSLPELDCSDVHCRELPPLRATVRNGNGYNAVRFPALKPTGQHVVDLPNPSLPFDPSTFTINQIGLFLSSEGTVLSDHPCMASNDCTACRGEPGCPTMPPPTTIDLDALR